MDPHHLVFLDLLERELGRTIIPAAGNDASRQLAAVALQQVKRILVDETLGARLRTEAIAAYRALLPELRGCVDDSRHARLAGMLDATAPDWPMLDDALGQAMSHLLARDDERSRQLAARLAAVDARLRAEMERAVSERAQREPPAADAQLLGDLSAEQQSRLLDFLQRQFPSETELRIAAVRPLAGGYSKQTLFVDLAGTRDLPECLVMRRDPPYETQGTSVAMEFPVLRRVHAAGVSVPKPYAVDATGEVLGTPFMLVSRVAGRSLGDFLVVREPSRTVALNLAKKVAALHRVSIEGLEALLPGGRSSVRDRVLGEIERHQAMWDKVTQRKAYVVQAALDWLKRNIALAEGPRALVHRDVGLHNLLVEDDDVTGFLDWETVAVGTPAEDIAYAHYQMVQIIEWDEFVAAYEQAAGVELDRRQLDFYTLWASLRIAIGLCSMVEPVYRGERASLVQFYVGDYFTHTLLDRIAAKLAEVLAS